MATSTKILGNRITFKIANKVERTILVLFVFFFYWFDVLQNKVLDLGKDYRVTFFENITANSLDLAIVVLIIMHILLVTLFIISLESRATSKALDLIVGTLALFGIAILLSGFTLGMFTENVRFLFIDMKTISFYHIGVGIEIFSALFWAFTK